MRARSTRRIKRIARKLAAAVIGFVVLLVVLELVLSVAYRGFVAVQERQNRAAVLGGEDELRILCIGESTTAVSGDATGRLLVPETSYPTHLERILNERQDAVRFRVINNGMMGGTTNAVIAMLGPSIEAYDPHMIIAMMGIKDTEDDLQPGLEWLPQWVRALRTVQLVNWAAEAVRLRQEANIIDVQSVDDLPEALRPGLNQLSKFVLETRMIGDHAELEAKGDLQVATYLWFIDRHRQAAEHLQRTIERYGVGYNLLSRVLVTSARMDEAEAVMRRAIASDPAEGMYHVSLAYVLIDQGRHDDALDVLALAEAQLPRFRSPTLVAGYLEVARAVVAQEQGDHRRAVEVLEAVRVDARLDGMSSEFFPKVALLRAMKLGESYVALQDWPSAERHLTRALELRPGAHATMWTLSKVYRHNGEFEREEAIRRSLLENRQRMAEYYELAKLFRIYGEEERIPELFDEGIARIPSIAANHQALYDMSERAGVDLVVMQYPSFGLQLLHKYAPPADGVYFIDNEHIFDRAPDDYFFEPTFPNSFSHYTDEGAELLANHVADRVLEIYADRVEQ